VSVTRRSHPATEGDSLARMLSRWQDGYGVVFAVRVQIIGHIRVSRYKLKKYLKLSHDVGTLRRALEQCRVTHLQ